MLFYSEDMSEAMVVQICAEDYSRMGNLLNKLVFYSNTTSPDMCTPLPGLKQAKPQKNIAETLSMRLYLYPVFLFLLI
jgi:hypothetical protein